MAVEYDSLCTQLLDKNKLVCVRKRVIGCLQWHWDTDEKRFLLRCKKVFIGNMKKDAEQDV